MAIDFLAKQDFERAIIKGFWRRVLSLIIGMNNELLPFDVVRERLPLKGQHYLGMQQVAIDQIVGSIGRYLDFDRAFLPRHNRTMDRWINIDRAHYQDTPLPPIELYKMGEVYFVKDGNHRVSVARHRGQVYIDALVTEIDIPVPLTADMALDDLAAKQAYAQFLEQTQLSAFRPEVATHPLETGMPGQYEKLLEHIAVHRWYLGEQRHAEIPYSEAVVSWYDNVYHPLVDMLRQQGLTKEFPRISDTDLYLWIVEYQWYLSEIYRDEGGSEEEPAQEQAARQIMENYPLPLMRRLVSALKRGSWVDELILRQEAMAFEARTAIDTLRPDVKVRISLPGRYDKLLEHIAVHRWYLGEQRHGEVTYPDAVVSWVDNVYLPLARIIQEQNILDAFPGRTEADLYLWIHEHKAFILAEYGEDLPLEEAAEKFAEGFSTPKKSISDK